MLDINLLKSRMGKLGDVQIQKEIKYLDLNIGETKSIRFLPLTDGNFCKEFHLYYGIASNYFVAPCKSGKPDPVAEQLEADKHCGVPGYLKPFTPKLRCVAPVLVRGEEDKGIQIFTFNQFVYLDIIRKITTNPKFHNATDPIDGFDFTVSRTKADTKSYAIITVNPSQQRPLFDNPHQDLESFMDTMPDIDSIYTEYDYEKMKDILSIYTRTNRPPALNNSYNGQSSEWVKPWDGGSTTSSWQSGYHPSEKAKPF